MRWDITKMAWVLAKKKFPDAKSLFVSLPVRFKPKGDVPIMDLSSRRELGRISYSVTPTSSDSLLVLECENEQAFYFLPPSNSLTVNTERTSLTSPVRTRRDPFNYRQAKKSKVKKVKDFPPTVHLVQDGNAMIVADVFEVRKTKGRNKHREWWLVRPAGASKPVWVPSEFIRPIRAGTVVASTAPERGSRLWQTITGPEDRQALRRAFEELQVGDTVQLRSLEKPVSTLAKFKGWEEIPNPIMPTKKQRAILVQVDETGETFKVVPRSSNRKWDVSVFRGSSIEEAFRRQGFAWAVCNDPIMQDHAVRAAMSKSGNGPTENLVAILAIEGQEALAKVGSVVIRVPVSSLKPAIRSEKGLEWIKDVQSKGHPFKKGEILRRDGDNYLVRVPEKDEVDQTERGLIAVVDPFGKNTFIPNDGKNQYVGVQVGTSVYSPMTLRSKELAQETKQKLPVAPAKPVLPAPRTSPEI